jgi:3-phenylpropionate/trans-cinnamate dioxygenase ferredoxin component
VSDWVTVCHVADLPPGAHRVVEVDGAQVAVFNLEGELYAIEDVCTHDGQPLTDGPLHGCEITCPRHGARFDIRTGKPLCMPATEPVRTFEIEVRGNAVFARPRD